MNYIAIPASKYTTLLNMFPVEYRDKLKLYTAQELFYTHRLLTFEAEHTEDGYKGSDVLMLALKAKMFRYLEGVEKYPVHPSAWAKLGKRWAYAYSEWESQAA